MKKTFYTVLEVAQTATSQEIKKAYQKMVLKYHPDRNQGNTEAEGKFKEAKEAYENLKDNSKRAAYDMKLREEERIEIERINQEKFREEQVRQARKAATQKITSALKTQQVSNEPTFGKVLVGIAAIGVFIAAISSLINENGRKS